MTINDILEKYGIRMTDLSKKYGIPYRTIQDWKAGVRTPPDYVLNLIDACLSNEKSRH